MALPLGLLAVWWLAVRLTGIDAWIGVAVAAAADDVAVDRPAQQDRPDRVAPQSAPQPPSSPSSSSPAPPVLPTLVERDGAEFHHLHLVAPRPEGSADFYVTLFPPSAVVRGVFWQAEGVRGDDAFILVSRARAPRKHGGLSAIWHFGWGKVSVGETYAEHYLNEVNWRPPYASLTSDLHVHLKSRDPLATAAWYEAVMGARREAAITPSTQQGTIEGRAEAIVRLGKLRLVIHRTDTDLISSREADSVDHLSFVVPDVKMVITRVRESGIRVLDRQYDLPNTPAIMIEGPDRIVLELLDLKGPRFLRDHP